MIGHSAGTPEIHVAGERARRQVGFDGDRSDLRGCRAGHRDSRADCDLRGGARFQALRRGGLRVKPSGKRHVRVFDVGRVGFARTYVLWDVTTVVAPSG